jgi:hypothetical protein
MLPGLQRQHLLLEVGPQLLLPGVQGQVLLLSGLLLLLWLGSDVDVGREVLLLEVHARQVRPGVKRQHLTLEVHARQVLPGVQRDLLQADARLVLARAQRQLMLLVACRSLPRVRAGRKHNWTSSSLVVT